MAVLGMLGYCPFYCSDARVLTVDGFKKKMSARFAEHAVLGRKPVLEYVGPSLDEISFTIRLDAGLGTPPNVALAVLERMVESGDGYLLLLGAEYYGRFVIESIDQDRKNFSGHGVPSVVICSLSLKETAAGGVAGIMDAISDGTLSGLKETITNGVNDGISRVRGLIA